MDGCYTPVFPSRLRYGVGLCYDSVTEPDFSLRKLVVGHGVIVLVFQLGGFGFSVSSFGRLTSGVLQQHISLLTETVNVLVSPKRTLYGPRRTLLGVTSWQSCVRWTQTPYEFLMNEHILCPYSCWDRLEVCTSSFWFLYVFRGVSCLPVSIVLGVFEEHQRLILGWLPTLSIKLECQERW